MPIVYEGRQLTLEQKKLSFVAVEDPGLARITFAIAAAAAVQFLYSASDEPIVD